MARSKADGPFRVNLKFNGPDKDLESRAFGELFQVVFGAKLNLRRKRDRALHSAALSLCEVIDIDAKQRAQAKKRIARRGHA